LGAGVTTASTYPTARLAVFILTGHSSFRRRYHGGPFSGRAARRRCRGNLSDSRAGYFLEQATRPQTIGTALADSPVGQARGYTRSSTPGRPRRDVESALTKDQMLDDISLYWLTNSAASSARIYWRTIRPPMSAARSTSGGVSVFPRRFTAHRAVGQKRTIPSSSTGMSCPRVVTSRHSSSQQPSFANCAPVSPRSALERVRDGLD